MQTRIIEYCPEAKEFLEKLLKMEDIISIDLETEPFDFKNPLKSHAWQLELQGIGLYTSEDHAYLLPGSLAAPDSWETFQKLLNTKKLVAHNKKFELTVLETFGFDISKMDCEDTMIVIALCDENQPSFGLKNLARTILRVPEELIVEFKDVEKQPEDPALMPEWRQKMANYCLDDTFYCYQLYNIGLGSLLEQGLHKVYTKLELPFIEVLRQMEKTGILLDEEKLRAMGVELDKEISLLEKKIHTEAGHEFDINSVKQLKQVLFEEKGYKLPKDFRTPKGEMSTNVEALEYLASAHGSIIAQLLLKYRELTKINSTYVKGLLSKTVGGAIHASFWQTGTVTGRLSSSEPNLQNIPSRPEGDPFDIRAAFRARPGYVFVDADYSQIELRLMAYYSGCPSMVQTYKSGGDIHQATADAIGCTRSFAKVINFGLNYGMSAYALSRKNSMPEEEADRFVKEYFKRFPEVRDFMDSAARSVRAQGYVSTILGRRRRFPEYAYALNQGDTALQHRVERQCNNAIIQGSAADILKLAMIRLHEALKPFGARILIQVHDELIIEAPEAQAETVAALVKQEMESAVSLGEVPLTTNPKISTVWKK